MLLLLRGSADMREASADTRRGCGANTINQHINQYILITFLWFHNNNSGGAILFVLSAKARGGARVWWVGHEATCAAC